MRLQFDSYSPKKAVITSLKDFDRITLTLGYEPGPTSYKFYKKYEGNYCIEKNYKAKGTIIYESNDLKEAFNKYYQLYKEKWNDSFVLDNIKKYIVDEGKEFKDIEPPEYNLKESTREITCIDDFYTNVIYGRTHGGHHEIYFYYSNEYPIYKEFVIKEVWHPYLKGGKSIIRTYENLYDALDVFFDYIYKDKCNIHYYENIRQVLRNAEKFGFISYTKSEYNQLKEFEFDIIAYLRQGWLFNHIQSKAFIEKYYKKVKELSDNGLSLMKAVDFIVKMDLETFEKDLTFEDYKKLVLILLIKYCKYSYEHAKEEVKECEKLILTDFNKGRAPSSTSTCIALGL